MSESKAGGLTFDDLRSVNVPRCVEDFGHTLDSWSPAEWTNAMCGEAGEAANVAKKILRHRDGVAGNVGDDRDLAALKAKLVRELADVVIYADLCAAAMGQSLAAAIIEKFDEVSVRVGSLLRLGHNWVSCGCSACDDRRKAAPFAEYEGRGDEPCPCCQPAVEQS